MDLRGGGGGGGGAGDKSFKISQVVVTMLHVTFARATESEVDMASWVHGLLYWRP